MTDTRADIPDLDAATREQMAETFEHLNGSHPDTVVFVARHLADDPDVDDAEIVGATATSISYEIGRRGERRTLTIDLDTPISGTDGLYAAMFGHLAAARAADPDGELTSIEAETVTTASLPTTHVTVSAVSDVTPTIRQITFQGIDPGPDSHGDEFVLVMLPEPGQDHLPADATMQSLRDRPVEEIPPMAYYTVRRWRPETREIDAWFVLHNTDGGVSGWAASVEAGATCALWGPRRGFEVPAGTTRVVAFVDETGIAAAYATAETLPADTTVEIVAEWAAGCEVPSPPDHPGLRLDLRRRDGEPGTGTALVDAARAMTPPAADEAASVVVLGAAESKAITQVRRVVRRDWELPATQVSCVGYWRR